jgi:predicted phosphoribosyltransferase/pimeloyl-ACP methyl ester carboxylesterase
MGSLPFPDREAAARALASALSKFRTARPVVIAIPRGGVPMGRIVADALGGDLDVALVRKLGAPGDPEFAIGAVDEQGNVMLNEFAARAGADNEYVSRESQHQLALIRERRALCGRGRQPLPLAGRTVIVVDDGLATGSTMIAALKATRAQRPSHVVCAVPVAAQDSLAQVARLSDEVVCLATPSPFNAVGRYFVDFSSVSDEQVIAALDSVVSQPASFQVRIPAAGVVLHGDVVMPPSPRGLIVFVHGSGSSRLSPRNRFVASALNRHGFATLLFDLLTPREDEDSATRFDIQLLAQRLDAAITWARTQFPQQQSALGMFGASTGAAAAIAVAATRPDDIRSVVSRGGRPDLAGGQALSGIRARTLLIVGGEDRQVLELNRAAQAMMRGRAELAIVPGASHLFEEPGTLERAAEFAADWFGLTLA